MGGGGGEDGDDDDDEQEFHLQASVCLTLESTHTPGGHIHNGETMFTKGWEDAKECQT